MERILDRQNSSQIKKYWKPVLIINGILLLLLLFLGYHFLFSEFETASYSIKDTFVSIFMIACFGLTLLNVLCLFISLFFSKNYWKQWLFMVALGVCFLALSILIEIFIRK